MKIGVIGASGKAGALIAAYALQRGHEVTAIVRDRKKVERKYYARMERDLFDLTPLDVAGFDAVVSAFGTAFDEVSARDHVKAMEHLIGVFEQVQAVRLIVVGGAGSLFTDDTKKRLVLEDIPPEWRAVPENQGRALELLRKSRVNWTFFSPAAEFNPFGFPTGNYVVSGDVAARNSQGESYIGYRDYASALVDEIEQAKHLKARFTAATEKNDLPPFPPPAPRPNYSIWSVPPVLEGMSQYRPPLNYELAGRQFRLVMDGGESRLLDFRSGDTLTWGAMGEEGGTYSYECAKIDELCYFVNFELEGAVPRSGITVVLDTEQSLVTVLKAQTRFDLQLPTLCRHEIAFGYIALSGRPAPLIRHHYTADLVGKRIHWHYSPTLEIIHVYYNTTHHRVTFPPGKGWGDIPAEIFLADLEAHPYDESAAYIKIRESRYLVTVVERNLAKRGMGGNSLAFLIDTERVHDVGRSFGHAGSFPDYDKENYIFGAYGDWAYSDGELEAKPYAYED
jgi:putative NADH-flavin reductase